MNARGFALPMVAVSIALLALGLTLFAATGDALNRDLGALKDQAAVEIAGMNAEAHVVHLLLTEPVDQRGLRVGGPRVLASGELGAPLEGPRRSRAGLVERPLVFDGRPYRSGAALIAVQDEAGLLNLNGGDDPAVARLLAAQGVSRREAEILAGALGDFVDPDDLRRLNGAEARDYRRRNRAPPRNRPLDDPHQALGVLGWREAMPLPVERRFLMLSAANAVETRINLNTAPPEVLAAVLGVTPRVAALVERQRERRALATLNDVAEVAGVNVAGGVTAIGGLPMRNLRLSVQLIAASSTARLPFYTYRSRIQIAAEGANQPVSIRSASLLRGRKIATDGREQHGDWSAFPLSPTMFDRRGR